MITFTFTRVQTPKCPIMYRLSTGSGTPRSGIVNKQDSNLVSHLQSIVYGKNQTFNSLQSECAFVITFTFTRVQKPKCLITFTLSTGSGPPRSGIVIEEDSNLVSHLQSTARSKPKLQLLTIREYLCDYIRLHKSAKTKVFCHVDD